MKKIVFIFFVIAAGLHISPKCQVLNVPEIFQEQNQWCWAGVSACVLQYYNSPVAQCDIAEYTRTVSTWHNFGTTHCCTSASQGCNYWNYNWGYDGSIQDILFHFAYLANSGVGNYLSQPEVTSNIQDNSLFIIRWGWTTGGGHFIVGHGISGNNLYYMDPWYGEGKKIGTYSWVCSGSNHDWTHTNVLTNVGIEDNKTLAQIALFPNPVSEQLTIEPSQGAIHAVFEITNSYGQHIESGVLQGKTSVNTSHYRPGIYFIKINNTQTFKFCKGAME